MIWQADAVSLGEAFAAGRATPVNILEAHHRQVARLDPILNAYSFMAPDARSEAAASEKRWRTGSPLSPLDGVPIILKDNLCASGMPASWGNAALSRHTCASDEAPVARLRAAGLVILGKGNTPEFSVDGYTDNLTFGATCNPFNPDLTPGGSSGGVVAAVAAGMAVAGLATDGGGSIRRPAGYTGLCGLKPGIGHVARAGGLAQVLLDFEVVGPVARSIRDLRAFDAILTGRPTATDRHEPPLRILAVERLGNAPCDPAIRAAFAQSTLALSAEGHTVQTGALPVDLAPLDAVWGQIAEIGLARYFDDAPMVAAAAAPKYREMAERGATLSATHLFDILSRVFALREVARDLWGYDAILMPTSAANPWPATRPFPPEIDGQAVGPRGHAVYTGWVNAAGLPALALPAPVQSGLPIGMQLVGRTGSEAQLLRLGEALAPPFRWPAMSLNQR